MIRRWKISVANTACRHKVANKILSVVTQLTAGGVIPGAEDVCVVAKAEELLSCCDEPEVQGRYLLDWGMRSIRCDFLGFGCRFASRPRLDVVFLEVEVCPS